jgi:uncharacterized protein
LKIQLGLLEQLQAIDNLIDNHERNLEKLPIEVQEIARNMVIVRREIDEAIHKLALLETDLKKKEQDLALEQEKIKKSERLLLSIKNQKEYNALAKEISYGKKIASQIEDATLEMMNETESLRKVVERKQSDLVEMEKDLLTKKTQAEIVGKDSKDCLQSLSLEKNKISESIEKDFFKRYSVVKKARGNAVVEMQNGTCTGCHMAIPPQLSIRVLKQEEFICCPNCNRILYVKPENIPEFNKFEV